MLFSLGANVAEYALHHTHEDKQGKKKKLLQYIQMTVFNLYNLCKMPCNFTCCGYSHSYEYLIKTPPAFSKSVNIHTL